MHVYNSSGNIAETNLGRAYNPAFMHPHDLERLGIAKRDLIDIRARHASVVTVAEVDESVRPGCVSMTHAFGDVPELDDEVLRVGSTTGRLLSFDGGFDRYSGQPRMSNIPVDVHPHEPPVPA
jgi:anaerobic selenocysteine-containing dehydrogenase